MKKPRSSFSNALFALLFVGCAGVSRSCSSCNAEEFGADWVIVQMDLNGTPFRCWELPNTSVTNESQSDGVYWKDSVTGNLVHLSGHYNRVQVVGGNWDRAFEDLGLTKAICKQVRESRYEPEKGVYLHPQRAAEKAIPLEDKVTLEPNRSDPAYRARVNWCLHAKGEALKLCKEQGFVK